MVSLSDVLDFSSSIDTPNPSIGTVEFHFHTCDIIILPIRPYVDVLQDVPSFPSEMLLLYRKDFVKIARKYDAPLVHLAISAINPDKQRPAGECCRNMKNLQA